MKIPIPQQCIKAATKLTDTAILFSFHDNVIKSKQNVFEYICKVFVFVFDYIHKKVFVFVISNHEIESICIFIQIHLHVIDPRSGPK